MLGLLFLITEHADISVSFLRLLCAAQYINGSYSQLKIFFSLQTDIRYVRNKKQLSDVVLKNNDLHEGLVLYDNLFFL